MVHKMRVFNNLTRKKEEFVPLVPGEAKLYSCGPTTYDFVHVGNARAFVTGDLMYRVFKALGYKATLVRNFTDIDDKIINKANELGVDALEHAAKFIEECKKDMDSLGMAPADHTPLVSETLPEIIAIVQILIDKGFAYEIDGEVLYEVSKFEEYGKLSKKDLDSLQHGIRVETADYKRNPADFSLWKPAKTDEPSWDSPWGKGRPGWHIECSAMAKKHLGDSIDLHHGGVDLMFPHHENEIAQSEAANGCSFSNYWCHNEFVNFSSEKMSKSLGNVITIRQFVTEYGGEILRQILASTHYRSKIEWSNDVVDRALKDVERINKFLISFTKGKESNIAKSGVSKLTESLSKVITAMGDELANDFNVPGAMSHFFTMIRDVNREYLDEMGNYSGKDQLTPDIVSEIEAILEFTKQATGLIYSDPKRVLDQLNLARKKFNTSGSDGISDSDIDDLVQARGEARASKDWAKADEIRDKLKDAGVVVKDNPDGTVSWSYK